MRWKWFWIPPLAIIGIALFIFLGGEAVKWLWNWLLPPLFGWRLITFWQGLGLLALCRILFGGLGGGHGNGGSKWQRRKKEHCDHMTPEERERLRQGVHARWGSGPPTVEGEPH